MRETRPKSAIKLSKIGFEPVYKTCEDLTEKWKIENPPSVSLSKPNKMQNEEGQVVDLYVPRKCSATNRLITSKDHASVQLNIGHLDQNGIYNGAFTTFALSGNIRAQGDADSALDRLWHKKKQELGQ